MELKKSPKANLENKRGLFLEIGLAVTLVLMIVLFAWGQTEKQIAELDRTITFVEEEIPEITRQDQKPPEMPKQTIPQVSDFIEVVKDDVKITDQISFDEWDEDLVVAAPVERKEEAVVSDEPFLRVEEMPKFQGGDLNSFRTWVQGKLNYPTIAAENGIQGKVTVSFVIEPDGTLTNIEIMQSPDRSLSDETTRVLKTSPKWTPGKQRNQPVRVKYTLPVDFKLTN